MSSSLSPQRWFEHIDAWKQTNQTQADYCREKELSPHQFSYWKRKQNKSVTAPRKVKTGFAIAQIESVAVPTSQPFSVTLPDGTTVNGIDASNLHVVTQLLGELR